MSEPTMTPELEQRLRIRLQARAERLAKVAAMPHFPTSVLALMAEHVTTTAMLLLGAQFSEAVFAKLLLCLRSTNGICFCGQGQMAPDKPLCAACWEQAETDDRDIDQMVAMDARVKGRPS